MRAVMSQVRGLIAINRRFWAALLFCAFTMRILVPGGYMPAASASGVFLTLCTAQGAVEVKVDLGEKQAPSETKAADCIFAFFGGACPLPALLPQPFVNMPAATLSVGLAVADLVVSRLAAPPPPALGPPSIL